MEPFPYKAYSVDQLRRDFDHLLKLAPERALSRAGLTLIEYFHPSIWACNVKGRLSPLDAWQRPEVIRKVIANRCKYLHKSSTELTSSEIRAGLTIAKLAPRVSIFTPARAKYLINKYLGPYKVVFDPCAGFSGRLLGAASLDKTYVGQDINSITVVEAQQLSEFLKIPAMLQVKDSLYDGGEYDCLFTCPPYADKEHWHQDIEILTAEEWITACLANYKCQAYLFVVDDAGKYSNFIVEQIWHRSHFGTSTEKVVFIRR